MRLSNEARGALAFLIGVPIAIGVALALAQAVFWIWPPS